MVDTTTPADLHSEDATTTLARWRAEEAAVRARLQGPGIARPEQIACLTGLEWFAAVNAGQLPAVPICVSLGFWPMEFDHGRFVFQGRTDAAFLNPLVLRCRGFGTNESDGFVRQARRKPQP